MLGVQETSVKGFANGCDRYAHSLRLPSRLQLVILVFLSLVSGCGVGPALVLPIPASWQEGYEDAPLTLGEAVSADNGRSSLDDAGSGSVGAEPARVFTLRVTVEGLGDTDPPVGRLTVPAGSNVVVRAIPADGYWFAGWVGDVRQRGRDTVVVVDEHKTVRAVFRSEQSTSVPQFHLPWSAGERHQISQGNGGLFSHAELFAWDIPMPVGSPVLASSGGVVVDLRNSIRESADNSEDSSESENFVAIDHGGGLKSLYAHLDFQGVAVKVGQIVSTGQVIGYSGNTGFSTAPHLHYEMRDALDQSVSTGFFESFRADGIALVGDEMTSRNVITAASGDGFRFSTMPRNAFAMNDVELLDDTLPAFLFETETVYEFRGRALDGQRRVCAALVDPESFETISCELTPVDEEGEFTISLWIPTDLVGPWWFGVIAGDGGANGLAPIRIQIVSPFAASDAAVELTGR